MGARTRAYGWISDLPDHRDHRYPIPRQVAQRLPRRVDLRTSFPRVYSQGQLQSCTANAVASAVQFARRTEGLRPDFQPSRLFIYYNARALRADTRCDTGAQIRDAIKCVAARGACSEDLWPYRVPRFEIKPSPRCYRTAISHRAVRYQRVRRDPRLVALRACLASGHPFVFGMAVYAGFESVRVERSGVVPMPGRGERHIGHGHAVLAVGYDDAARRFIVRNSWGEAWGQHGYFTLPYAYLAEPGLSDDFWTIRAVNA
ncbi:MAG TPA: C1 family peptidase [bacterium]|nr:C1 family peptidase [bacterium]